jgi:predicted  nucleic acid-binding Zn-ribbon protein
MTIINNTQPVQLRRVSTTNLAGNTMTFPQLATNVKNDSIQHPQKGESKKTVHLKEIKNLKKDISTALTQIKSSIDRMMDSRTPSWKKDPASIKNQLTKLTSSIQAYQDKLDSTSYKHHHSKQETLTKLNAAISENKNKINTIENEISRKNVSNTELSKNTKINRDIAAIRAQDYKDYGHK